MSKGDNDWRPLLRRGWLVGWCALAYLFAYWFVGHHHQDAQLLPLTPLDEGIPFVVWTIWPYLALDVAAVVLPVFIRDRARLHETLQTCGVAILLSMTAWVLYPTVYPRPPLPAGHGLSVLYYDWFRSFDAPANCLPSGHIVVPFVVIWGLARDRPSWGPWLWTFLAVSSPSLLTLKQHYIVDLPAGLAVALVSIGLVRVMKQQPTAAREPLFVTARVAEGTVTRAATARRSLRPRSARGEAARPS